MSGPPDEHNLNYKLLTKANFERNKALKEASGKHCSPWSKEAWQAAAERFRAGVVEPERRFPVIITSLGGPFTSAQKLKEVAGLSSVPEVHWTTRSSIWDPEEEEAEEEEGGKGAEDKKPRERVQYCDVNWNQLLRVKEYSDGENLLVWFQGKKRFAWLALSTKQKGVPGDDVKHNVVSTLAGS